jgi:hypothetical protein
MGWQDRGYNAGREEMKAYFANPLGLLQYALPIWRSAGLSIHLSFWFLLAAVFLAIDAMRMGQPDFILAGVGLMLAVCLFHEYGHRLFARMVGGNHWEWVLWPVGGLVAPSAPRTAKATFVANAGGIAFNLILLVALLAIGISLGGTWGFGISMLMPSPGLVVTIPQADRLLQTCIEFVMLQCSAMVLWNLFPCYWFDGGHLWQSVLWPFTGQWKAGVITCWAGMILAAPLFLLSLYFTSILGMLMWALIFADCFRRRQLLVAAGEGVMEDDDTTYNYMDTPEPPTRKKKRRKNWLGRARKRALQDQTEQARIDAILAKVKEKGLHSLSWWEKRTLKKATARQRERDLANRF